MDSYLKKRIWSFAVGGVLAALMVIFGICNMDVIVPSLVLALMFFTFSSCLILNNNFIFDFVWEISSWGFVRMPGVIFTLDLDGIIWLITVKLLFFVLGLVLAIAATLLAIVLGCIISVFVYPYAIIQNIRQVD